MSESKTITLTHVQKGPTLTFKDLFDAMAEEIEIYKKLDKLDELEKQEINVGLNDLHGNTVFGSPHMFIGWVENGGIQLAANVHEVVESTLTSDLED